MKLRFLNSPRRVFPTATAHLRKTDSQDGDFLSPARIDVGPGLSGDGCGPGTDDEEMPGSGALTFGDVEDFEAALRADGILEMLVTARGQFRARLTQLRLDCLRLAAIDEALPRIAVISVPAGMVLVSFPIGEGPSPIWGGIEIRTGEIITLGPGQRVYARTAGSSHWGTIRIPVQQLVDYGRAMNGAAFIVPPVGRWRPPATALRQLRHLCRAGIRMAEARAEALTDIQAAHALEQQLFHALIDSLSGGAEEERQTARRHRALLVRFEDQLAGQPTLRIAETCVALGVSEGLLRACCKKHLGMSPRQYDRRRRMQQAHRALRSGTPDTAGVSEVARRHGFDGLSHFAACYRASYGELPSDTLRRAAGSRVTELNLARPRMKFS